VFKKVLFVCVGNICRSPTAEILMRHQVRERLGVGVSSAGLQALVGHNIDATAGELLIEAGHDPVSHRARQASGSVLAAADLILVMEQSHLAKIAREYPQVSGKTFLLGKWNKREIPDPYRQQRVAFEHVYKLIEESVVAWAPHIK
jgi:protein-tyrosine phosphatase